MGYVRLEIILKILGERGWTKTISELGGYKGKINS